MYTPVPANLLSCDEIYIVHGHEGDQVRAAHQRSLARAGSCRNNNWGRDTPLSQVIDSIPATHLVVVLYGDVPADHRGDPDTRLWKQAGDSGFSLLTARS